MVTAGEDHRHLNPGDGGGFSDSYDDYDAVDCYSGEYSDQLNIQALDLDRDPTDRISTSECKTAPKRSSLSLIWEAKKDVTRKCLLR